MRYFYLVIAVRAVVRATAAISHDGALKATRRRQREMADPEDKVRPLVCGDAFTYPLDYSLFEMNAG